MTDQLRHVCPESFCEACKEDRRSGEHLKRVTEAFTRSTGGATADHGPGVWSALGGAVGGRLSRPEPHTRKPLRSDVLAEADRIIHGDRHEQYGPAEREFERVAVMWSQLFGHPVSARQVALAMVLLKVCREAHQHKRDSLVDIAGYAALANEIAEGE